MEQDKGKEEVDNGGVRVEREVRPGDYVLATKYGDGGPGDQWSVGFFTGMLREDRFMVADADGNQFRGNGFRRVKKISAERGRWLLEHKQDIEMAGRSLWWWVRRSMA